MARPLRPLTDRSLGSMIYDPAERIAKAWGTGTVITTARARIMPPVLRVAHQLDPSRDNADTCVSSLKAMPCAACFASADIAGTPHQRGFPSAKGLNPRHHSRATPRRDQSLMVSRNRGVRAVTNCAP
jgi:hypothetical protein